MSFESSTHPAVLWPSTKYDAWGKVLSVTDANGVVQSSSTFIGNINPIRYRGYYYDAETGLFYVGSRYYDPEIGRFINADAAEVLGLSVGNPLGANLFAYCYNNPVMYSDPSGYIAANVAGAIIVGVIGAIGGTFLGIWLADKLGIKSWWKRALFISGVALLVGAAAAAIGFFIGPYIAKFGTYIINGLRSLVNTAAKQALARVIPNKINHIMLSQHAWKLVTDGDWAAVSKILQNVITNGSSYINDASNKVYFMTIGKQIVEVETRIVNGVFTIVDAWVKTR